MQLFLECCGILYFLFEGPLYALIITILCVVATIFGIVWHDRYIKISKLFPVPAPKSGIVTGMWILAWILGLGIPTLVPNLVLASIPSLASGDPTLVMIVTLNLFGFPYCALAFFAVRNQQAWNRQFLV